MSARAMMLASMLALGLADTDANGRAEGGNESWNERHEGGAENGNERYGNEGTNEGREEDNDALHSRLLINAASSAVDMFAISRSLETFAVQNDKVVLKIYPLFVCPSGACPNGVCPEKQALLAGLGCVVNTQAPPRVVPLQAGAPVPAAASGTSVLDFVVHSADPKFGGVAIQRIEAAVTQNLLANQGVTGFKRIMEVGGDVEGGNENHEGGRGENNEGRHGAGDRDGEGGDEEGDKTVLIVVCSISAVVVISVVVALIYFCCCRKTEKDSDEDIESQTPSGVRAEVKNMEVMNDDVNGNPY